MERLAEILAVEASVLEELAMELRIEGMDDYARRIFDAIAALEGAGDPLTKIKRLIVTLRPVDYALEDAMMGELATGLRRSRHKLADEADRFLGTPGRHRSGEYPELKKP